MALRFSYHQSSSKKRVFKKAKKNRHNELNRCGGLLFVGSIIG